MQNTRYDRGVKNPDPVLSERIAAIMRAEPTVSRSELARRVGVTRQTVGYYLRALTAELADVAAVSEGVRTRRATNQLELVEHVGRAAAKIEAEIETLSTLPIGERRATAMFRGYGTLATYQRLIGELLGEISPATTNVYMTRVEQLLTIELPDDRLPADQRGRIGGP